MKTIGLIGGMSWESTAIYYRLLNLGVQARLGGHHSAKVLLASVDFAEVEALQRSGEWERAGAHLAEVARGLERAGADFLVLATNTMHKVAPAIAAATSLPLLHIADATGRAIRAAGLTRIALLGTRFTMEHDFYAGRLREEHGLEVMTPDPAERVEVHRVIYEELVFGRALESSRNAYSAIIDSLASQGAQGVILGCTEIAMLITPDVVRIPSFDTTALHAEWAVAEALSQ